MKMFWKNCPYAFKRQYHNPKDGKITSISAEAWCDRNLYIWHWHVGRIGTNNDSDLLMNLPMTQELLSGKYSLSYGTTFQPVQEYSATCPTSRLTESNTTGFYSPNLYIILGMKLNRCIPKEKIG